MDISELQSLPIDQKIEIIGRLWDDIDDSSTPIRLSPAVIAEVEARRVEHDADPLAGISRDEMWRRVNQTRRENWFENHTKAE